MIKKIKFWIVVLILWPTALFLYGKDTLSKVERKKEK